MRILLVGLDEPNLLFKAPLWMPVYLPSLGASLRAHGHQVAITERISFEQPGWDRQRRAASRRFAKLVSGFAPDVVLFDVEHFAWGAFRRLAKAGREAAPGALLLAGGRHATLCPEETLEFCAELDAVAIGEAENTMRGVAGGRSLRDVPGLMLRLGIEIVRTADAALIQDLDSIPMPAWDLIDMKYYTRRTPRVIPCIPLKTASFQSSRGCPWQCAFCTEGRVHARIHRFHSAEYVAEATELLIRNYAIEGLYFRDEDFLANPARVVALCETLVRRGLSNRIRWSAQVRPDSVSPEILRLMRQGGCVQLEFGIESGSQRVLDSISKGTAVEQNLEALKATREAGIRSLAYVMYGIPGETRDDLLATASFLKRANPDIVRFNAYKLHPGAPVVKRLQDDGVLPARFWKDLESPPASSDSRSFNVSAMALPELRRVAARVYRGEVFPRFIRDFMANNRMLDVPRYFNIAAVLPHFAARLMR